MSTTDKSEFEALENRIKVLASGGNAKKQEAIDLLLGIVKSQLSAVKPAGKPPTPSSRWYERGDKDPHGDYYQGGRENLTLGEMTDDELANAVFLYGDRPSLDDLLSGKIKPPIVYLTAAKERIRWLSRMNNKLLEKLGGIKS